MLLPLGGAVQTCLAVQQRIGRRGYRTLFLWLPMTNNDVQDVHQRRKFIDALTMATTALAVSVCCTSTLSFVVKRLLFPRLFPTA